MIAHTLIIVLSVVHLAFFAVEYFGANGLAVDPEVFGLPPEQAGKMASVLKNVAIYNLGTIAVGLPVCHFSGAYWPTVYLLAFIVVAGIVGFLTIPRKVGLKAFLGQTVFGAITLGFVLANWPK